MASSWRHIYFREALKKDFQENFCGTSLPGELKESALMLVNVSILSLRFCGGRVKLKKKVASLIIKLGFMTIGEHFLIVNTKQY